MIGEPHFQVSVIVDSVIYIPDERFDFVYVLTVVLDSIDGEGSCDICFHAVGAGFELARALHSTAFPMQRHQPD